MAKKQFIAQKRKVVPLIPAKSDTNIIHGASRAHIKKSLPVSENVIEEPESKPETIVVSNETIEVVSQKTWKRKKTEDIKPFELETSE